MPTITVQRHDLYRLAGLADSFSLAELDDRLALVKGELGARAADGSLLRTASGEWLHDGCDHTLRIELKDTNRPDLWSVEGIARQLRDHSRGRGADYGFFATADADPPALHIDIDPLLATIRPFIGGFLAAGGVIDDAGLRAFIETQETLTRNFGRQRATVSIGIYNGEALAFPIRYQAVAREGVQFVPLPPATENESWQHGLALTPAQILADHPTGRQYAGLLAGFELVPYLVDACDEVLSLPPIINSAGLGRVTPGLTKLFVEVTGTELDQCLLALNILATNLADRGWTITPVTSHYPYDTPRGRTLISPTAMPQTQNVPSTEFARLLGEVISEADVVGKLTAYGVETTVAGAIIAATIPSYRQDYLHNVDVIEDYAISRGYASVTPTMAQAFSVGRLDPLTQFEDLVRDLLIGFGFEEAICNILTSYEQLRTQMNLDTTDAAWPFHGGATVAIANVMNLNYAHVRDWVLPSLLEIEAHSGGALYPHRIFEVGEVAVFDPDANLGSRTESRLAALIADEEAAFDSAQSLLYALLGKLLGKLGVDFSVTHWAHPSFIPGRVALVTNGDAKLGFLGELAPEVLTNWGARVPIAALELSLTTLSRITSGEHA